MDNGEYYGRQVETIAGMMAAFFIGLLVCLIITLTFYNCGHREGGAVVERDTIIDTFVIEKPISVYDTIIRYVKKKPIVLHDTTIVLKRDTDVYITPDTQVVIPITQKVYEDSLYKAWVSGYMPSLDRIEIYRPTITITKKERWSWGLQGGAGYDVISNRPVIYIGIGGTLRF